MEKLLIDANVLIALFRPDDALTERSNTLVNKLKQKGCQFYALNLVIQESATVISMRKGMDMVRIFRKKYKEVIDVEIDLDHDLEDLSWKIFLKQIKKGSSFVDCANLAAIEKYKLDGIVSFDKFYPLDKNVASRYK